MQTNSTANEKRESKDGNSTISYNKGSIVTLGGVTALGVGYLVAAQADAAGTFGPSFVPTILGILLIVSCLLAGFITVRQSDRNLPVGDIFKVAITLALTIGYLLAWDFLGIFYIVTPIYLFALASLITSKLRNYRATLFNATFAIVLTAVVYLFFDILLGVRF